MRVGVISDTHGLLRPEALRALRGSELILHAGDVGSSAILDALRAIAPVIAVRGNNDRGPWARALPECAELTVEDTRLLVIHDLKRLRLDPAADGLDVVVAGHSHMPRCERRGPVLFFNPGSAGPRRFRLPVALGKLTVRGGRATGRIIVLE